MPGQPEARATLAASQVLPAYRLQPKFGTISGMSHSNQYRRPPAPPRPHAELIATASAGTDPGRPLLPLPARIKMSAVCSSPGVNGNLWVSGPDWGASQGSTVQRHIPLAIARDMLERGSPVARQALARYPPAEWIALRLAQNPELQVRQALAACTSCPPAALRLLARRSDTQITVLENPNCPPDVTKAMVSSGSSAAHLALIKSQRVEPDDLATLAGSPDPAVRTLVAQHSDVPLDTLRELADDPDPQVRSCARLREPQWQAHWTSLARTKTDRAWWQTALTQISTDWGTGTDALGAAAQHLGANPDLELITTVFHAAKASGWAGHMIAAQILDHPECPAEIMGLAVRHNKAPAGVAEDYVDHLFQSCVAQNPSCPPELLSELLRSHYPDVAKAAASNPRLPTHLRAMWQLTQ